MRRRDIQQCGRVATERDLHRTGEQLADRVCVAHDPNVGIRFRGGCGERHMNRVLAIAAALFAVAPAHAGDFIYFDDFEAVLHPVGGSVIISEIMSKPTAVSESSGEWFELTNVSAQTVDLGDCIVGNGSFQDSLPSRATAAGDAVVVARSLDPGANGDLPVSATFAVFSFSLGPTGMLGLACNGRTIDEAAWTDETAGRSLSLDPARASALDNDDPANWCFATTLYNAVDTGSPGQANETCPTTGGGGTPPAAGELSITELMIDPAVLLDANAEWVELRNTASGSRDLGGCVLNNGTTDSSAFPAIVLDPGSYALIGRTTDTLVNGGLAIDATFAFGLNNGSGTLAVKCGGDVIDTIAWASSTSGRSLQRDPVTLATICTAPAGVAEYTASNFGTPKADNAACP
ncbi:MAG TPA: lamin tail domain-containing protein [Rudaea sp.]|nr:lamin tail domain-containing protein [Rudaea sp.]